MLVNIIAFSSPLEVNRFISDFSFPRTEKQIGVTVPFRGK